jgi:hypothetical protein
MCALAIVAGLTASSCSLVIVKAPAAFAFDVNTCSRWVLAR